MKTYLLASLLLLVCLSASARHTTNHGLDPDDPAGTVSIHAATAQVAFSPRGQGQQLIVDAINGAHSQILVQAYGFSNKGILAALADAKRRGVDVEGILDKTNDRAKYSGATYMANAGVPVWIDYTVSIAHNKVMVIDKTNVITGSYNFTEAAQNSNAENVLYLKTVPDLAKLYITDWLWRQTKSRTYQH